MHPYKAKILRIKFFTKRPQSTWNLYPSKITTHACSNFYKNFFFPIVSTKAIKSITITGE